MNDLISRQAAIDAIEEYFDGLPIAVHYDMTAMIHRLPSAQPERKKGEWLIEPYDTKNDIWVHRCSECLMVTMYGIKTPRFKFCPNCGADMRGEE